VTGSAIGLLALLLLLVLLFYWWRWRDARQRKAKLEQELKQLQELLKKLQKPELPEMVKLLNDALLRATQQDIPIREAIQGLLDAVDWNKPFDGRDEDEIEEIEVEVPSRRPTNELQRKLNELEERAKAERAEAEMAETERALDGTATATRKGRDEIEVEVPSRRPTNEVQRKPNESEEKADDSSEGSPTGGAATDALAEVHQPGSTWQTEVVPFIFTEDIGDKWDEEGQPEMIAASQLTLQPGEQSQLEKIARRDRATIEAQCNEYRRTHTVDDGGGGNPSMFGNSSMLGDQSQLTLQPGEQSQ